MKRLMIIILVCVSSFSSMSQNYTGIYNFNKGINKANGNLVFFQFKTDSAFVYLNTLSGAPDFMSADTKGFVTIENQQGIYKGKGLCEIKFILSNNNIKIIQDTACKNEFTLDGIYKKTSPQVKKATMMMLNYIEKKAIAISDTLEVYEVPHAISNSKMISCKGIELRVIDEFQQYYLVEHKKYKNEFMWTLKKNIRLQK